jgi:hypothetical protein
MVEVLNKVGHNKETYSIIIGVLALISSIFFFALKFNVIKFTFNIPDATFLFFFAGLSLISGVVHLFSTIGVLEATN